MTPVFLTTFVGIVAVLPPTVDHWIAKKFKGAALIAFLTALFGVVDGGVVGLLSQVANGSTWMDAETLTLTGLVVGVGTAVVNFIKSSYSATATGGGTVTVSEIPVSRS